VVTQYQTTRHVEEALLRLTEAYMALAWSTKPRPRAAVLGHNFPDSRWYQDAYKLVKAGGFEPEENKGSWISRAFAQISPFRKNHRAEERSVPPEQLFRRANAPFGLAGFTDIAGPGYCDVGFAAASVCAGRSSPAFVARSKPDMTRPSGS